MARNDLNRAENMFTSRFYRGSHKQNGGLHKVPKAYGFRDFFVRFITLEEYHSLSIYVLLIERF